MLRETLQEAAPDERSSQQVIRELLARPRPLQIDGHPVRQIWEAIQAAFPDHEIVHGEEVEDKQSLSAAQEDLDRVYHVSDQRSLRTQTTATILKAIHGHTPPVRLLTAGRVFRPDSEDAQHLKVFHQADCLCIDTGVEVPMLRAVCEQTVAAILGDEELGARWAESDFPFVDNGMGLAIRCDDDWLDVIGCGMLKAGTLREAGYDPDAVAGYAFGLGLERLAALKFRIDDIRTLWQPPYVPG